MSPVELLQTTSESQDGSLALEDAATEGARRILYIGGCGFGDVYKCSVTVVIGSFGKLVKRKKFQQFMVKTSPLLGIGRNGMKLFNELGRMK